MKNRPKGWLYIVLGIAILPLFLAGGGFLHDARGQSLAVVCLGAWIAGLLVLGPLVVRSMVRSREAAAAASVKPSLACYLVAGLLSFFVMAGSVLLLPAMMASEAGRHGFVIVIGVCLSIFVAQGVGFLRMRD